MWYCYCNILTITRNLSSFSFRRLYIIHCPCCPQPCGSITPWHCSSVWVWMCSGVICLLTATTKRTRTVIKTLWLRLEPFRHWRELCTLWMNSQQIIGTFMGAAWYSASKSGHTATACRAQLHRRRVHYPAANSPNLDEHVCFALFMWLSAWKLNVITTEHVEHQHRAKDFCLFHPHQGGVWGCFKFFKGVFEEFKDSDTSSTHWKWNTGFNFSINLYLSLIFKSKYCIL